jgi:hypothetical protein
LPKTSPLQEIILPQVPAGSGVYGQGKVALGAEEVVMDDAGQDAGTTPPEDVRKLKL